MLLLCNGKIPLPSLVMAMRSFRTSQSLPFHPSDLLRETTQSSPLGSSTNLKSGQKSFSPCQGARLASRNWRTILVNSGVSDTWHGVWTKRDLDFLGWVVGVLFESWTPANSLLPQWHRVGVVFSFGLYLWQKPLYFLAQSSKLLPNCKKAGCHWVNPSSVKRS